MELKLLRAPLLLAVLGLLVACDRKPVTAAPVERSTPVRTAVAVSGPAMPDIRTSGVVVNKDEMKLSFKVGGVVKRIVVQEGEPVRQGQTLAEIDLTEVNAQLERARQLAEKAQRDRARGERLYADQVISLEQLQDLRTQAKLAGATLQSARFNRGYSVISAPRAGTVLRKMVEAHELVTAGQTVLVLGARDAGFVVQLGLADRDAVQLQLGDAAVIRMDAFPGRDVGANVSQISSAADARTGLFPVELHIAGTPLPLVSGLVASVIVSPASARSGSLIYVPIAAVVAGDADTASVYVVDGDHVRRRAVRVAFMQGTQVALSTGLRSDEVVVTDGALYLADQEKIHVVNTADRGP